MSRFIVLLLVIGLVWYAIHSMLLRVALNRELMRRGLRRVQSEHVALVNPAPGWRVIESCVCARGNEHVLVVVVARGWFSRHFSISEQPVPSAARDPR